jgi:hypothetical protein
VFYPVFPPDKHAQQVLAWLRENPGRPLPRLVSGDSYRMRQARAKGGTILKQN